MSADKDRPPFGASSAKARLFFALWPTSADAQSLVDVADPVAKAQGGRLTRRETVHLTLIFLGEIDLRLLGDIRDAAISCEVPPFRLEFDRLEPWSRQRLIVARCDCPPPLALLVDSLRSALAAKGIAVLHPEYAFKPHVTLVRGMPAANRPVSGKGNVKEGLPASLISAETASTKTLAIPSHPVWDCDRFVLVRSLRSENGSVYQVIAEFPLLD